MTKDSSEYEQMLDRALGACEESFTTDITQHTPTYVALQDAVKNYVEENDEGRKN